MYEKKWNIEDHVVLAIFITIIVISLIWMSDPTLNYCWW
jgi:hypothetical protein